MNSKKRKMKVIYSVIIVGLMAAGFLPTYGSPAKVHKKTLKEVFEGKFLIGTALNTAQISGKDTAGIRIIEQHFNAIVPDNCMKSAVIHPQEDQFDFRLADQFVNFGEQYKLFITGHTLIWHSQLSSWFCVDKDGKNVSAEVLKERMKKHILTVVGRYKGRVKGWDVVNEAIEDNGSYRKSKFYEILGEDYIPLAFQYAHEADPEAELYYNDYNMEMPGKSKEVVNLVKKLKGMGIRIDAVGMQSHMQMNFPTIEACEKSMEAFAETGVKVMVTELDLSALPRPKSNEGADVSTSFEYRKEMNPYINALPDSALKVWNKRMNDFFKLFVKHHDIIERVTLWGVSDRDSWLNNWPIKGRTDYPLLFDRRHQQKAVVDSILQGVTVDRRGVQKTKERYLVPGDYMADPSVHVFNGKLYIYPSHDRESGILENDNGDHFDMRDYHVFSLEDAMQGKVTDHGVVLSVKDIPWAGRQLWAPDAAYKDGKYYLYFPLKDKNDIFRIGVAIGDKAEGPFVPEADAIKGSYSIDPAVLDDGNGSYYMYFGGLWGGQLQRYRDNKALECALLPQNDEQALSARVARLSDDMKGFAEAPRSILILDKDGKPLKASDTKRRFFEGSWMHKYNGKYYFSYSTGDTHLLCYATGDNPYGPFTYQGVILTPVVGWTTHHSIVEFKGKWYLFHHDSVPSGGKTWLRSIKVCELEYNLDGTIKTIEGTDCE